MLIFAAAAAAKGQFLGLLGEFVDFAIAAFAAFTGFIAFLCCRGAGCKGGKGGGHDWLVREPLYGVRRLELEDGVNAYM